MSLPSTPSTSPATPSRKPLPTISKPSLQAMTASASAEATLANTSADSLHFGQRTRERTESIDFNDRYPEHPPVEPDYTLPERLLAGGKHGLNKALVWNNGGKECIKADFKKSLWITLLTLPLALIIPGPQLAIPPVWVGYKFLKRFYQGAKAGFNDPILAEKRAPKPE
jgi:hypothetical protein